MQLVTLQPLIFANMKDIFTLYVPELKKISFS
jgi:hypothetical protein